MDNEIAIELSRLQRAAIEAVRRRMAELQTGELFTDLDKVNKLPDKV
jgi:hypothetical protein